MANVATWCSALARRFYRYSPPVAPRQSAALRRPAEPRGIISGNGREHFDLFYRRQQPADLRVARGGEWAASVLLQVISIACLADALGFTGGSGQPQTGKAIGVNALGDVVRFCQIIEAGSNRLPVAISALPRKVHSSRSFGWAAQEAGLESGIIIGRGQCRCISSLISSLKQPRPPDAGADQHGRWTLQNDIHQRQLRRLRYPSGRYWLGVTSSRQKIEQIRHLISPADQSGQP